MPTATVSMPAATAPISPKTSGFTKPAGFGRSQKVEEEEEPQKDHPVIIGLAALTVLLMAYICYLQFSIDQMPNRQTDDLRVFGAPSTSESGDDYSSSDSSADEEDSEDSGASEESGDSDEEEDE